MTFTVTIRIVNDQVADVAISDNAQPVSVGGALQAVDAARAALLGVTIAQPQPTAPLPPA